MPNLQAGRVLCRFCESFGDVEYDDGAVETCPKCRGVGHMGKYRTVNLSWAQMEKIGLPKGLKAERLGCGLFACAYKTKGADAVVKITSDSMDAITSYMVKELPDRPRWVVPVHGVWRIKRPFFVVSTALADKLPEAWKTPLDVIYDHTDEIDLRSTEWDEYYEELKRNVIMERAKLATASLIGAGLPFLASLFQDEDATPEEILAAADRMDRVADLINDAVHTFRKLGLAWADFHSDNWGWLNDAPVVIDLGMDQARDADEEAKAKYPELDEIPMLRF